MSESAQVHSIELLKRLHGVLARFGVDAQAALDSGAGEVRRAGAALAERLKYWQQQSHKRQEELNQARAALSHARALRKGQSIGCVEQELAVRKAQERLREAEGKILAVRRWQRELPELVKEFEGPARALSGYLEADLRQTLVLLEAKVAALQAYLAVVSPTGAQAAPVPALAEAKEQP
jgi:hypothetical protein